MHHRYPLGWGQSGTQKTAGSGLPACSSNKTSPGSLPKFGHNTWNALTTHSKELSVSSAWHLSAALSGAVPIQKAYLHCPMNPIWNEVLLIVQMGKPKCLRKACQQWCSCCTMHGYDGTEPALIVNPFVAPGKIQVWWFMRATRRARSPAATVDPACNPSTNQAFTILIISTIIYW